MYFFINCTFYIFKGITGLNLLTIISVQVKTDYGGVLFTKFFYINYFKSFLELSVNEGNFLSDFINF